MAVLHIAVLMRALNLEAVVVKKKFVARGDIDIVTVECDATKAPVCAAAFEIYPARVPVDVLHDFLFLKIYRIHAPVTLALLAAAHDGSCDELW